MKTKKILVITAALMLTLVLGLSIVDQDESDATVSFVNVSQGTITPDGGDLYVEFKNSESIERIIEIEVTNNNTGKIVGTTTVTIPADATNYKATVHVNFGGVGEYNAKITCTPADYFDGVNYTTTTVNVTESIWSSWTAYAAIIAVVILVVIAVFLHMRNAPKIKPDKTFTELESERSDDKPSRSTERIASSTEKRKYKSAKSETAQETPVKKTEPVKPVKEEPKKAQSFTEMEEKKKVTKEKKESSDDTGSKKPKYVSSRRK